MSIEVAKQKRDDTWPIVWKSALVAVALFAVGVTVMFPKAVLQMVLPDQTVYASGFSEKRFAQVQAGMDEQRVLAILGAPLEVVIEPESRQTYRKSWRDRPTDRSSVRRMWWDYSRPGRLYDSFNVRSVELSPSGKVVAVERHFYQD
jgi:hypothetical protein